MMGYSAVTDQMNLAVQLPLYLACVSWTILYDTVYAQQDLADDLKLGLNTSADVRSVHLRVLSTHLKKCLKFLKLHFNKSNILQEFR